MNKKDLFELLKKGEIDSFKEILANEIITPTNGYFSSLDERPENITFNGETEQWRDYGKKYKISNFGRVKDFDTGCIIPQINTDKNLYLDKAKWEQICEKNNIATVSISSGCIVYYQYIKPLWLDEKEREFSEKVFAEILKNNEKDKLIIHHINNFEDDNRVQNLIYVPNSLHGEIHSIARNL